MDLCTAFLLKTPTCKEDGESDATGDEFPLGRWAISPERCWTQGYWFILSTYIVGACLLFFVSQPDLRVDPILRTYNAFHPCVIIDYSPGNLWAQLTFLLYVYCLLMSATVSLIRVARLHNGILMVISSWSYGVAWIGMPILVLSCTFNPRYTSVLSHSIPYMICIGSIGVTMLSELVVLYVTSEETTRKHVVCYIYNAIMLFATGYAILFMSKLLGETKLINVLLPVTDPSNILQPVELNISPFTTILAFCILPGHWLRPFFSPLTARPVSADVEVRKGDFNFQTLGIQSNPDQAHHNSWRIVFDASTLGFWGRLITASGFGLAYYFNTIYATEPQDIRGKFTNNPGAAIIAVTWSAGVPLMILQALVLATYVRQRFKQGLFKCGFVASALFVSVSAVLAHGGTVPHAPSWYLGPELFSVGLLLWGVAECGLLMQESEMTPMVIFKLCVGTVGLILMVVCIFHFNPVSFIGFLCAWMIFSFFDPMDVKMVITNIEVGTVKNSPETTYNTFFNWVWCDDESRESIIDDSMG